MRIGYAKQYKTACIILDAYDNDADDIIEEAKIRGAIFHEDDPDDECFVVQFPGRPKELYTANALRRSFPIRG